MVAEEEVLGPVLQFALQIIVLRYFADGLEVPLQLFALLAHLRQCVTHFVEHIPKADDPHDFDEHSDDDFGGALRSYVSVADGQHRR